MTELPLSVRRVSDSLLGIRNERVADGSQIPEEGIMPKQSMKTLVAKTCAVACIFGLSANTFMVAGQSVNRSKTDSSSASTATIKPTPTPAPKTTRPAAQNQ